MFDIGWSELVVIGVVALIVVGPKELPGLLRSLGKALAGVRRMAGDFQSQFNEAMREAELDELKKEVDALRTHATGYLNVPNMARDEIRNAIVGSAPAAATTPAPAVPADNPPIPSGIAATTGEGAEPAPPAERPAAPAAEPATDPALPTALALHEPAPLPVPVPDIPPPDPVSSPVVEPAPSRTPLP
jgi:sec-independent protein translocase protein TatB